MILEILWIFNLTHKFGRQVHQWQQTFAGIKSELACLLQKVYRPSCSTGSGVLSIQHTVVGLLLQLYWWLCTRNCWRAWIQVASLQISSYAFCLCQWSPGHQDISDKWIHQETYGIFTSGSLHVTHFHFPHSIVVGLGWEHRQPWHQDQLCSSTSGICGFGTSNQPTVVVAVYMGQWKW